MIFFLKELHSLQCYQNKNMSIVKNCGDGEEFGDKDLTTDYELVDCPKNDTVCLKIKTTFGYIKSCGGQFAKILNLTDGECKKYSNGENWEIKIPFVEVLKRWYDGTGNINATNVNARNGNQTTLEPSKEENQTIRPTQSGEHCWDDFAKNKGLHIGYACQCSKVEEGSEDKEGNKHKACNDARRSTILSFYFYFFAIAMIVTVSKM